MKISPKIFWGLLLSGAAVAAFSVLSEVSFAKSFNRDVFPGGRPAYLSITNTLHEKNFTWALVGPSKSACLRLAKESEWTERVAWKNFLDNPTSPERKMIGLILSRHDIDFSNIDKIYSEIVDGSDIVYLITFKEGTNDMYFGILCAFRT